MGSDLFGGIWNGRGLWKLELELDLDKNWTGESDRCDRTLRGSGTGTYVSESDRCDRTLSGSRTSTAWLDSFCLAGPPSAWQESGTELVSRIDVIGLFLDPEQELMFQSRIDVIGLLVDPGPRQLGWNSDCLAGLWNGTGESDRCDRTLLGSGTGTYISESDRM